MAAAVAALDHKGQEDVQDLPDRRVPEVFRDLPDHKGQEDSRAQLDQLDLRVFLDLTGP